MLHMCVLMNAPSVSGGLGEAVAAVVSEEKDIVLRILAVRGVPRSAKCAELLDMFGISATCIVKAVKQMVAA